MLVIAIALSGAGSSPFAQAEGAMGAESTVGIAKNARRLHELRAESLFVAADSSPEGSIVQVFLPERI